VILGGSHSFEFGCASASTYECFILCLCLGFAGCEVPLMCVLSLVLVLLFFGSQFDCVRHMSACPEGCVRSELLLVARVCLMVTLWCLWFRGGLCLYACGSGSADVVFVWLRLFLARCQLGHHGRLHA